MKLSIITINFNDAAGLQRTLDSIRSQTYVDYEQIIVDGGSIDSSVSLLKKEASKLASPSGGVETQAQCEADASCCAETLEHSWRYTSERLKIVSEKDKGVYDAQNKGIAMASGEYLLFLNSGDILHDKHVLEDIFENKEQRAQNKDICSADIMYGDVMIMPHNDKSILKTYPDTLTLDFFCKSALCHQTVFFRKELFEKHGLYDIQYRYAADWLFTIRCIILHNCSYRHLSRVIADYDLSGMSFTCGDALGIERSKILATLFPQRVLEDYARWNKPVKRPIYKRIINRIRKWLHK